MLSLAAMNLINSIVYKSNEILKVKNSKQTDICQVHVIKSLHYKHQYIISMFTTSVFFCMYTYIKKNILPSRYCTD